ncbi:MAG: hypothetical protein OXG35_16435, partial [Acidobacteria bacterium]|nr:hypothetical protein [Acidobacteriota bacterium]
MQPLIRHDGVTDRRCWESALFVKVRDEIQTGKPPPSTARRTSAGRATEGASVGMRSTGFLEGVADDRQVAFDDDGWRLKTDAAEQPDPAQSDRLAELHRWLDVRSRSIRLADLLIEVENDLGFSVHFQQPGEKRV